MSASPDQFSRHFQKQQERRRLTDEVVDPDAPPLPDDPVEPAKKAQPVGRNDACPCGSGKKYKKCCGKKA